MLLNRGNKTYGNIITVYGGATENLELTTQSNSGNTVQMTKGDTWLHHCHVATAEPIKKLQQKLQTTVTVHH
jgi:hypothetical protein